MRTFVPLGELIERVEAGKSLLCDPRPAALNEWGVIKVSAMTYGTFREHEQKAVPSSRVVDSRYEIQPGDLLVSRANTTEYVGASVLVGAVRPRLLLSDKSLRLIPHADVAPRWLHLMLQSPPVRSAISVKASGTKDSMRNISQEALLATPLPLIPLDEQHRIITVLDGHLSRLEAAGAYLSAAARRTDAWERLSVDAAVDAGSAETCAVGNLVERIEAGRSFGASAPAAQEGEWGVIRVSAMTWGEFRPKENKAVPAEGVDPRYEIRPGDLLVSRANTTEYVGAPVLVGETRPRLLLSDKSLRLVPKPGVEAAWLAQALASRQARRQMSALATGTKDSMRNISQANLAAVRVPAPPEDQSRVVEQTSAIRDHAERLRGSLTRERRRAAVLRGRILTAAFTSHL